MKIQFHERHITPTVKGATVKEKMQAACKYLDVAVIATVMLQVQLEDPTWDFYRFEQLFRELGQPIYLIAAPRSQAPFGQIPMDFRTYKETTHWLWICVEGPLVASMTLKELGLPDSESENLEKLKDTGMMVPQEGA